jgi:hypothetical protein
MGPGHSRWTGRLATAIRSPLRCEQSHQEAASVLPNGDLDVFIGGDSQQSLSDRDRLLIRIETDFKDLIWSFELSDQALELARLLFARAGSGAQLARWLASFVHERRIGFPNCDHLFLSSTLATVAITDNPDDRNSTIRLWRRMNRCRVNRCLS